MLLAIVSPTRKVCEAAGRSLLRRLWHALYGNAQIEHGLIKSLADSIRHASEEECLIVARVKQYSFIERSLIVKLRLLSSSIILSRLLLSPKRMMTFCRKTDDKNTATSPDATGWACLMATIKRAQASMRVSGGSRSPVKQVLESVLVVSSHG